MRPAVLFIAEEIKGDRFFFWGASRIFVHMYIRRTGSPIAQLYLTAHENSPRLAGCHGYADWQAAKRWGDGNADRRAALHKGRWKW
jgi:hypothetical protein